MCSTEIIFLNSELDVEAKTADVFSPWGILIKLNSMNWAAKSFTIYKYASIRSFFAPYFPVNWLTMSCKS